MHFQAGLVLEQAVSQGLRDLGIPHRQTVAWGREDIEEALDFVIPPSAHRPGFEIQLTLRAKHQLKRLNFALSALRTRARGIRLYVEVVGSRRKDDLVLVGKKVARAIQTIVSRFRNFGPYNLLGVVVNVRNGAIHKFDLVQELGARLKEAARRVLDQIESKREAQSTHDSAGSPLIHLGIMALKAAHMHTVSHFVHERRPHRANRFPTRRPFLPRRFC